MVWAQTESSAMVARKVGKAVRNCGAAAHSVGAIEGRTSIAEFPAMLAKGARGSFFFSMLQRDRESLFLRCGWPRGSAVDICAAVKDKDSARCELFAHQFRHKCLQFSG